jgi:hypothetical protein
MLIFVFNLDKSLYLEYTTIKKLTNGKGRTIIRR